MSSYTAPKEDTYRVCLFVALANSAFSLTGGFAIFAILGNLANPNPNPNPNPALTLTLTLTLTLARQPRQAHRPHRGGDCRRQRAGPRLRLDRGRRRHLWGGGQRHGGAPLRDPTTHHSLLTAHDSPLTTHHSPLTAHYSPLTTHHLLPTT
eukprot:scaffold23322_cov59-Phaeocystis_antarctica.AAC.4